MGAGRHPAVDGVAFRTAFPDIHVACQAVIADGDQVALYSLVSGTNHGELMGMPPTGKSINMGAIEIYRVVGNKMVRAVGSSRQRRDAAPAWHWRLSSTGASVRSAGCLPVSGER